MNTGTVFSGKHCAALAGAALLLALSTPALALALEFPGPATAVAQVQNPAGSAAVATGPWQPTGMQTRVVEGALDQTAYRIDATGLSTLQIMTPLRDTLRTEGYSVLYECETVACGGFDFRFGLNILPEPDMHVDMGDYRYLSAERSRAGGPEVIGIIVSRSANAGFIQITQVGGALPPTGVMVSTQPTLPLLAPNFTPTTPVASAASPDDLGQQLEIGGAIALDDLVFASGAATLADGTYASLAGLATYLKANPARTIAFVGHTDASGGLEGNIALSRQRAQSVRAALIATYDVPGKQVAAEGVGYLSPRTSNLTAAGRAANRRVEVMLTSTE